MSILAAPQQTRKSHSSLSSRITKRLSRCGISAPSAHKVARILADSGGQVRLRDLAHEAGIGRTTARRAARRLEGLGVAVICEPSHRGRGYDTKVELAENPLKMRDSARSGPYNQETQTLTDRHQGAARAGRMTDRQRPTADGKATANRPPSAVVNRGTGETRRERPGFRDAPDGSILVRGSRWWREAMREGRRTVWLAHGAERAVSDIVTRAVSRRCTGQPFRKLRAHLKLLRDDGRVLVERVSWALENQGEGAAFAAAHAVLDRLLVGENPIDKRHRTHRFNDGGYDLNSRKQRADFAEEVRRIAQAGGGPCPRCGKRIDADLLNRPGLAFYHDHLCDCIYVSVAKRKGWRRRPGQRPASRDDAECERLKRRIRGLQRWLNDRASEYRAGQSCGQCGIAHSRFEFSEGAYPDDVAPSRGEPRASTCFGLARSTLSNLRSELRQRNQHSEPGFGGTLDDLRRRWADLQNRLKDDPENQAVLIQLRAVERQGRKLKERLQE